MTETRSDFWSRRKARVEQEVEDDRRADEAAARAAREAELEEKSDAEILADLDLPDPDTLEKGDDFSVFMKQVVPERIRRRALRKLWLSNPVLANLDALVEYGEDYTDAATVVENLSTTYQVGKGMLAHVQEMERQAAAKEAAAIAPSDEPEAETEESQEPKETLTEQVVDADLDTDEDAAPATLVAVDETPISAETCEDGSSLMARRRMRFDFTS
ncbi:DUF3306 domain-containing protein [Tropicimonas sp. S265A]|uniref:DUF3306 domain-containing protein n=1 Tax=Tropicimonas sp. S265A TaxID=3415134 RepID=UPI003C7B75EB